MRGANGGGGGPRPGWPPGSRLLARLEIVTKRRSSAISLQNFPFCGTEILKTTGLNYLSSDNGILSVNEQHAGSRG
jgi:hypothetical protein